MRVPEKRRNTRAALSIVSYLKTSVFLLRGVNAQASSPGKGAVGKTKQQPIDELNSLRRRVRAMERTASVVHKRAYRQDS
jgi:hypothetical protein